MPSPPEGADAPSRILVVDDTEANRDMLSRRLRKQGHTVDTAESGQQALDWLARESCDLVLLDIMMPGMSGYDVLQRLKADPALRHVPVIMITAITDMESVVRCVEMGAEDHLPKPFNATLLRARIDASLAKKRLRDREQLVARAMARELEIGRNIQRSFLPSRLPVLPGWELAARFHPARQVAGDFYDAFTLPAAGRTAVVVADVCDKGVGAALFMAVFRSLLRVVAAEAYGAPGPAEDAPNLARTVRVLSDYNARTHAAANMFATLFFGVLDPASGSLTYVNAGHDPPMVFRDGRLLTRLQPTGAAVGLLEGLEFTTGRVELAPRDLLLAFTDGVTDARGSDGTAYGEARLETVAGAAGDGSACAGATLDRVEADLARHTHGAEPFDDITMLALERTAP